MRRNHRYLLTVHRGIDTFTFAFFRWQKVTAVSELRGLDASVTRG